MGTTVEQSSAEPEIYKRASAFRMVGERVDGQDVEAVYEATDALMARAREEREPAVLEVMTYRLRGHSVADAGTAYRTKEEIAEWADKRDPIALCTEKLVAAGATNEELDAITAEAQRIVDEAVAFAEASPMPDASTRADFVYGDAQTGAQFARMRPGSPAGEGAVIDQLIAAA
jgi:pyruvate dehydrogenase E1 component alpha subunit